MAVNVKNWQELKKPNALERKLGGGDARRRGAVSYTHLTLPTTERV